MDLDHRDLDDIAGRALDRHVDGFAFGTGADGEVAVVDAGEVAAAAEERRDVTLLAGFVRNAVHVGTDAFVGFKVIVDHLACLGFRDADTLRQAESLYRICDAKIDDLCEAAFFLQVLFVGRTEHEPRGFGVDVLVVQKRLEHHRILRDVGEDTKFELRVISRDQLVAFFGNERTSDPLAEFGADRDVLQIRFGRAQTAGRRDRLVQHAVDAAVGVDHLWQGIGVGRLELVELAVIDDELCDLVNRRQAPARTSWLVEICPVAVFLPVAIFSSSKTSPTCFGEPILNSRPAIS